MKRAKFPSHEPDQAAGRQPEQGQENSAIGGEQSQKGPADVTAQNVLEQHEARRAQRALPEGIAQDDSGTPRVEPVMDLEPEAQHQVNQHRKDQQQGLGGSLQEEDSLQTEVETGLVGGLERQGCKQHVRQPRQYSYLAMVAAEHSSQENSRKAGGA